MSKKLLGYKFRDSKFIDPYCKLNDYEFLVYNDPDKGIVFQDKSPAYIKAKSLGLIDVWFEKLFDREPTLGDIYFIPRDTSYARLSPTTYSFNNFNRSSIRYLSYEDSEKAVFGKLVKILSENGYSWYLLQNPEGYIVLTSFELIAKCDRVEVNTKTFVSGYGWYVKIDNLGDIKISRHEDFRSFSDLDYFETNITDIRNVLQLSLPNKYSLMTFTLKLNNVIHISMIDLERIVKRYEELLDKV